MTKVRNSPSGKSIEIAEAGELLPVYLDITANGVVDPQGTGVIDSELMLWLTAEGATTVDGFAPGDKDGRAFLVGTNFSAGEVDYIEIRNWSAGAAPGERVLLAGSEKTDGPAVIPADFSAMRAIYVTNGGVGEPFWTLDIIELIP